MTENIKYYHYKKPFELEPGGFLPELTIAYHTYGQLNASGDNVVWVCHALTANSNPEEWWPGIVGPGCCFDPKDYFIVCANILGSCYGTSGAMSINPVTGSPYFADFPAFTIRDMVAAHELLRQHLGIHKIKVCLGGSCGGHQVLEYSIMYPDVLAQSVILVSGATETAWRIAIHTTQRMAIEADQSWGDPSEEAASNGLRAARGIGLLTYRTSEAFINTQSDTDPSKLDDYMASSYIRYQGDKLVNRFNAYSYWQLTKALDTHHIGRNRGEIEEVLSGIQARTLLISIDTDVLIPPREQEYLSKHIPNSKYEMIRSDFGHDGFLIEAQKISECINRFL